MKKTLSILTCLILWGTLSVQAQLPEDFYDQIYSKDYEEVMGLTFDQAGRLFIWEKAGRIRMVDSSGVAVEAPVLDISERVANWKDHGLMSVALDPAFQNNGYVYVYYTMDMHWFQHFGTAQYHPDTTATNNASFGRVSRFQLNPADDFKTLLDEKEHVLLGQTIGDGIPLAYQYHGLGSILVGTDGTILVSNGDNSANMTDLGGDELGAFTADAIERGIMTPDQNIGSYKSQYVGSLNGKVLRIDAETGAGVPSNPFYLADNPRAPESRIWAVGFRNPYRMSLVPETGSHYPEDGDPGLLILGDVGNGSWEELNIIRKGGENFGWPLVEGTWSNWAFWSQPPMMNPRARNPLYGIGGCDREFFYFRELLMRPYLNNLGSVPVNPCAPSQAIPATAYPMVESSPLLAWSNARWNPPTRAITADTLQDNIEDLWIDDERSPIDGEVFDGYSSLAGLVYTASVYPEDYRGKYFSIDYSGWIKVFDFDDDYRLKSVESFHNEATDIIHLALNPKDGQLYYINVQSEIHTISYGGNPPPVAVLKADRYFGVGPLEVQFDASQSYDSNLPIVAYSWDFGDGTTSDEPAPSHIFTAPSSEVQSYTVRLTVKDSLEATNTTEAIISLNNTPPSVDITSFEDGDKYPMGSTSSLALQANVQDAEHPLEELTHVWRIFFHHNDHYHPEPADYSPSSYTLISPLGCDFEEYWYRIELTVTDPGGLSTKVSQQVFPNCNGPFVETLTLTGEAEARQNLLAWTTATETNTTHFEVQRSADFFTFHTIGTVDAAGSTIAASNYQFLDDEPLTGTNIYRIKAYDSERSFSYSNMLPLDYPPKAPIRLFPNPAANVINIELEEAQDELISLELFDTAGRRLLNTTWTAEVGQLAQKQLFTTLLQNGFYFYRVKNGALEHSGKLIIAK
ncbi:MAG: PQQ-dependent sugar dehydrogenase [Bacteroidota bacterium]